MFLKGICKIRVKEGERLVSEFPDPTPALCSRSNLSHLADRFSSLCLLRKKPTRIPNRLLVVRYEGRGRGKREDILLMQKQCTESHFYFLFIIYMHTLDNRWRCSFSTLNFKVERRHGWQSRERGYRGAHNERKTSVYRIASVSTLSLQISFPRNSKNMCSSNNDLTSENGPKEFLSSSNVMKASGGTWGLHFCYLSICLSLVLARR